MLQQKHATTALSGAHTFAKPQQSPLIQSTPIQNQTQSHICNHNPAQIITTGGMTCPQLYRNPNHTLSQS